MVRTDFIENDRVLVTNKNGTSFRGLLSQLVTYIESFVRPYKVYSALITQSGTDNPTAIVLENTLGVVPVWTYDIVGYCNCTATGIFTENKTAIIIGDTSPFWDGTTTLTGQWGNENYIQFNSIVQLGYLAYGAFNNTFVEIRVYN